VTAGFSLLASSFALEVRLTRPDQIVASEETEDRRETAGLGSSVTGFDFVKVSVEFDEGVLMIHGIVDDRTG
jgi:hypothetical protein